MKENIHFDDINEFGKQVISDEEVRKTAIENLKNCGTFILFTLPKDYTDEKVNEMRISFIPGIWGRAFIEGMRQLSWQIHNYIKNKEANPEKVN